MSRAIEAVVAAISFADPDHSPGAYQRESEGRYRYEASLKEAASNLTHLINRDMNGDGSANYVRPKGINALGSLDVDGDFDIGGKTFTLFSRDGNILLKCEDSSVLTGANEVAIKAIWRAAGLGSAPLERMPSGVIWVGRYASYADQSFPKIKKFFVNLSTLLG